MTITTTAACTAESAIVGYLLQALAASGTYDYLPAIGLPPTTVRIDERGVIVGVARSPRAAFQDRALDLALALTSDVVMVEIERIEDEFLHVAVDLTLGLLPGNTLSLPDFALWTGRDGAVWLVPQAFGPAVSVDPTGLTLELIPPYETLAQRSAGLLRAANAMARIYRPGGAR